MTLFLHTILWYLCASFSLQIKLTLFPQNKFVSGWDSSFRFSLVDFGYAGEYKKLLMQNRRYQTFEIILGNQMLPEIE